MKTFAAAAGSLQKSAAAGAHRPYALAFETYKDIAPTDASIIKHGNNLWSNRMKLIDIIYLLELHGDKSKRNDEYLKITRSGDSSDGLQVYMAAEANIVSNLFIPFNRSSRRSSCLKSLFLFEITISSGSRGVQHNMS